MSCCRITDLNEKEVICVKDGTRLGRVDDVEVDTCTGHVHCIVVYGKLRCFGLFGRYDDYLVPWDMIEVIGEDTILVNVEIKKQPQRNKNSIKNLLLGN